MDSMDSVASFLIHMAVKVNVWTLLVAIESRPGPFFEVLTALGGGSEQSIICSKSILINILVICFKLGISTSHPNWFILVGNWYIYIVQGLENFDAHRFCSFPLPVSSTHLLRKTSTQKQWMEFCAGSRDPVALWKVQVAHHSNLRGLLHETITLPRSQQLGSAPTGSVKVSFFF